LSSAAPNLVFAGCGAVSRTLLAWLVLLLMELLKRAIDGRTTLRF
jgi:hypothetical protein